VSGQVQAVAPEKQTGEAQEPDGGAGENDDMPRLISRDKSQLLLSTMPVIVRNWCDIVTPVGVSCLLHSAVLYNWLCELWRCKPAYAYWECTNTC